MFRRVLSRLRGIPDPDAESIQSPPASEAEAEPVRTASVPVDWPESDAKRRMLVVPRGDDPPPPHPSPPSFSTAPPSDEPESEPQQPSASQASDDEIKPADRMTGRSPSGNPNPNDRKSEERSDDELALLLAAADNDDEAQEIVEQYGSEEGRKRLRAGESVPEEPSRSSARRNRRSARSAAELDDLIGSDEEKQVIVDSIRMNVGQTDGVTTRRGTVVGRGRKRTLDEARGVPLSEKRSHKQNFIERNRRSAIDNAIEMTRPNDEDDDDEPVRRPRRSARRKPKMVSPAGEKRRSSRLQHLYTQGEDDEDGDDGHGSDDSSEVSDVSMRSTASEGEEDDDNSDSESANERQEQEDSDEESDDDYEDSPANQRKRAKLDGSPRRGTRRSGRLVGRNQSAPSRSKPVKLKKKKVTRRRTNPHSMFEIEAPENLLTEQERRARLDALVKQSEEVAKKLNEAMAAEKERNQATSDGLPGASPGRTLKKSDGEVYWPSGDGKEMQNHQVQGVRWLLTLDSKGLNAILADEMGLGKTIQSIAFLGTVLMTENRGPHIVVAPKNVVPHWAAEFEVFYPGKFKVITHIGAGSERFHRLEKNLRRYPDFDVLVTSFDLALRDLFTKPRSHQMTAWDNRHMIRKMQKLEFEYAVIDEAHRLKNNNGKFNKGLRMYKQAKRRLLLTGTPLSNNLLELWSLMNVLNPRIFGSSTTFDSWFAAPFDTSRGGLNINEQSVIVDRLHTIIRPFFLRRLRADVCPSYSSADEVVIQCPQSSLQKALAMHFRRSSKNKELSVNNAVMVHRKIANHPFIASNALFEHEDLRVPRTLVGSSGKFVFLYWALPRLIAGGHRVLLFSQFRMVLDFLEDLMEILKFKYGRLDGETANNERENTVANFNKPDSDIPIFLLTTRAGGVGLNLQTADTVILFDSDWNPSADLQAVSRIQRIGQKRTVHIMRLVTENSVDEVIVERGREKLRTEAVAVGAGKFTTNVDTLVDTALRQKDLEQLLEEYEERQADRNSPDLYGVDDVGSNAAAADGVSKQYFSRWEPQLLRKGETAIPKFEGEVQSLTVDPLAVPEWIRPGCDSRCANYAIRCNYKSQIPAAIQKANIENASKSGVLPTKRERRERINLEKFYDEISDDDESEYEAHQEMEESDASDDVLFVPDELMQKRALKPSSSIANANGAPNKPNPANEQRNVPNGVQHEVIAPAVVQSVGSDVAAAQNSAKTQNVFSHMMQNVEKQLYVTSNHEFHYKILSKPKIEPMSDKSLSPYGQSQASGIAPKTKPTAAGVPSAQLASTGATAHSAAKPINAVRTVQPSNRMHSAMSPIARPIHRSSHSSPSGRSKVRPLVSQSGAAGSAATSRYLSHPNASKSGLSRPILPRPFNNEVIVIDSDSDDNIQTAPRASSKLARPRQASMHEMRAAAAARAHALSSAQTRANNTIATSQVQQRTTPNEQSGSAGVPPVAKTASAEQQNIEDAHELLDTSAVPDITDGEVDPALVARLREFTGVKDQAALIHALQVCNLDVHQAADQILMYD